VRARSPLFVAVNAVFLLGIVAVGAVSAWPIHRDPWYLLTATAAVAISAAVSLAGALRGWRWWRLAAWLAGAYLVTGVPLAIPSALADPARLPAAALQLATAPVTGWRDLLTLQLPLGTYQATLAPTLLLFLAIPAVALSLAWRAARAWVLAAPVALLLPVFGILFGSSAVAEPLTLGPVTLHGAAQLGIGVAAILLSLGWYVWRRRFERGAALRAAQSASGVRVTGRSARAAVARWSLAAGMLVLAVVAGTIVAPLAVAGETRDVLRTATDPQLRVRGELSPLTGYRAFFGDDLYDQVLFTVDAPPGVDRVRLATLPHYDGVVARVLDPDTGEADASTAFLRVPSTLAAGSAPAVSATVTIGAYRGIWVPVVGDLTGIAFDGPDRAALADGFFYAPSSRTGVELADPGLSDGVRYRVDATADAAEPAGLASLTPPDPAPRVDPALVPRSLLDWIEAQDAPAGGAGLAELVERLRARGYLSHALTIDESQPPAWMRDLDEDAFAPSRAGHSTDRIGALFTALLQRQSEVGATDDAALVAAAGDDEQFAVAAALVADQLGFPSRVVLGARLQPAPGDDTPACEDGACRGADMTAWIEVQDATGAWTPVDVTPQHAIPIAAELEQRSDPQNTTDVDPENAETVLPPDADPVDNTTTDDESDPTAAGSGALWGVVRAVGIALLALLVLLSPLLAVLVAKTLRRRARRSAPDPGDRVTGGWDEYVDAAVDHGGALPRTQTRTELAALYDAERAGTATALAAWADRAVFAPVALRDAEGDAFWELVDAERARLAAEAGWWARWRARASLRSFRRTLDAPDERSRRGRR